MVKRNRAIGWKHAKITGHENEHLISNLILNDSKIQKNIFNTAKSKIISINKIEPQNGNEVYVESVFGDTTPSKTDIYIYKDEKSSINISVKKSMAGQVFLIGVDRFIDGFEKQYNIIICEKVKRAISLFWGYADDTNQIIEKYSHKYKSYELKKHRLVKETMDNYNPELSQALIAWFNQNIENIFDFCFSRGLAKNKNDWADLLWYKNAVNENDLDELFCIDDIKRKLTKTAKYGIKNGGTTIQLPFGFVQWHSPTKVVPGNMQFHHNYKKIKEIIEERYGFI